MLRLDRAIKPWKEAAALNDHINLYGFWDATTFITKSGDVGMVLSVQGVDYESLDHAEQEYAVKRLESALKAFGPGFRIYQYLFKNNRPEIPFASYDDPVVEAAIDQRRQFFAAKRDTLFQIEIFYVVIGEGARSKQGVSAALKMLFRDPAAAFGELRRQFSDNSMKRLVASAQVPSAENLPDGPPKPIPNGGLAGPACSLGGESPSADFALYGCSTGHDYYDGMIHTTNTRNLTVLSVPAGKSVLTIPLPHNLVPYPATLANANSHTWLVLLRDGIKLETYKLP
jgi:hypothetical protein